MEDGVNGEPVGHGKMLPFEEPLFAESSRRRVQGRTRGWVRDPSARLGTHNVNVVRRT